MRQDDLAVWAKLGDGEDGVHPLACHLIDAGVVAQQMWSKVLAPSTRARIAEGLGLTLPETSAAIALLAALHDLGKASPAFQLGTLPDPNGAHRALLEVCGLPAETSVKTESITGRSSPGCSPNT